MTVSSQPVVRKKSRLTMSKARYIADRKAGLDQRFESIEGLFLEAAESFAGTDFEAPIREALSYVLQSKGMADLAFANFDIFSKKLEEVFV